MICTYAVCPLLYLFFSVACIRTLTPLYLPFFIHSLYLLRWQLLFRVMACQSSVNVSVHVIVLIVSCLIFAFFFVSHSPL